MKKVSRGRGNQGDWAKVPTRPLPLTKEQQDWNHEIERKKARKRMNKSD